MLALTKVSKVEVDRIVVSFEIFGHEIFFNQYLVINHYVCDKLVLDEKSGGYESEHF